MNSNSVPKRRSNSTGDMGIDPKKCALLLIEFQNEFTSEGGKLHGSVKENMEANGMLQNTVWLVNKMRRLGMKIFHAPISFDINGSDNPNKNLGILAGCDTDKLFVRGKIKIICNGNIYKIMRSLHNFIFP